MGNSSLKDSSNGSLGTTRSSKPEGHGGSFSANVRAGDLNNLRNVLFQAITRMTVDYSHSDDEKWLIERAGHFLEMYRTNETKSTSCPNLTKFICQMPQSSVITRQELVDSIPDSELRAITAFVATNVVGIPGLSTITTDETYQTRLHATYRELFTLEDVRVAYRCLYKQTHRDGNTSAFRRIQHMSTEGPVIDHCGMLEALRNLVQCYDMAFELKRSLPDIETLNRDPELQPGGEQSTKVELLRDFRSGLEDLASTLSSRGAGMAEDIENIARWDELKCLETANKILRTLRPCSSPAEPLKTNITTSRPQRAEQA
ncbi:hypothetical protein L218DRAFT_397673 [Marasmius fiardii PR-910]|nr:hypothetical protein L218DRAFT_397673 [Marasmius fiardii PR-910]